MKASPRIPSRDQKGSTLTLPKGHFLFSFPVSCF